MKTISTNTPTPTSPIAPTVTAYSTIAQHSPWHSPVPYLFGGLAAMLGLIAFALLILACSYWRLSGHLQNNEEGRDLESQKQSDPAGKEPVKVYEEKILVIMAGDEKPTFLATPVTKSSSFGDGIGNDHCDKHLADNENCHNSEKHMESNTPQENDEGSGTQQEQQQSQ